MVGSFVRGLLITACLYALASIALHWLMGVPLFWLTGLLAGLLYGVPYLGMLIVVVLACGLVVGLGAPMPFLFVFDINPWLHALLVFLGIAGLNLFFDWVVMPRLVGRALDLRMHESLLALLIGAKVAGVWGVLLAIPLGALFKRLIRQSRASPFATEPTQSELSSPPEPDPDQPNHSK